MKALKVTLLEASSVEPVRALSRGLGRFIFAVSVLVILFAGTFPFDFTFTFRHATPFDTRLNQYDPLFTDRSQNVLFFVPFGFGFAAIIRTQLDRTRWRLATAPLASFALFHLVTVFPLSWVQLHDPAGTLRFLILEASGAVVCVLAIMASGFLADRVGRRPVLGISAVLIGAYSGFAPQLLAAGELGEAVYMLGGFVLLGLSFGQSSGAVNSSFPAVHRYTGAAIVANSAWFIGAGFAPLVALWLASRVGLWSVGLYLLSGVIGTLVALLINREWAAQENAAQG